MFLEYFHFLLKIIFLMNINIVILLKNTPFFISCSEGYLDIVKLLIDDMRIDPSECVCIFDILEEKY